MESSRIGPMLLTSSLVEFCWSVISVLKIGDWDLSYTEFYKGGKLESLLPLNEPYIESIFLFLPFFFFLPFRAFLLLMVS